VYLSGLKRDAPRRESLMKARSCFSFRQLVRPVRGLRPVSPQSRLAALWGACKSPRWSTSMGLCAGTRYPYRDGDLVCSVVTASPKGCK